MYVTYTKMTQGESLKCLCGDKENWFCGEKKYSIFQGSNLTHSIENVFSWNHPKVILFFHFYCEKVVALNMKRFPLWKTYFTFLVIFSKK